LLPFTPKIFLPWVKKSSWGIKGTNFKFTSRDLDVFFPNRIDHYFSQELLLYTEEDKNNFLSQEGKKIISRLQNSNKIYVFIIVMFE